MSFKIILTYQGAPRRKVNAFALSDLVLVVILSLLMMGFGKALYAWDSNATVTQQAAQLVASANKKSAHSPPTALPSNASVPSTIKPALSSVADYTVAPNMPRYLIIPKLGVNARIVSAGVNAQGAVETPDNIYDTAWYNQSALPGQPGAMLIDGHISSWTAHGVFYGLATLVPGDVIQVERGDGALLTYQVLQTRTYAANAVDMSAALTPINPAEPGLNLISCGGDVIPGTNEFSERIVVFASQV